LHLQNLKLYITVAQILVDCSWGFSRNGASSANFVLVEASLREVLSPVGKDSEVCREVSLSGGA